MMKDLHNDLDVTTIAPPTTVNDNTPVVSALHDRTGFEGVEVVIYTGAIVDVDATFAVNVQHGDAVDGSDLVDVPDSQLLGTEAAAGFKFDDDNKTRTIGYVGGKRCQKVTVTPSGNASAATIGILAIRGFARHGK